MARYWQILLVIWMLIPVSAPAAENTDGPFMVPNPGTDLWREVRQRDITAPATTQVPGLDSTILINTEGEAFREYRRNIFVRYSGWLIVGAAVIILLFHLIHGGLVYKATGRNIIRFDLYDRIAHWLLACIFLFLTATGLLLLYGRFAFIPWLGAEAFAPIASASKEGHNLFGPLFLVALIWVFLRFVWRNLPKKEDVIWLLKGGGLIGKAHPSADFFNGGEKLWFWLLVLAGTLLSLSGLALDFPSLAPGRPLLILALVIHGGAAVILISASLGHIYMGTIGAKGTLRAMTRGDVDAGWAAAHHDLWYEKIKHKTVDKTAGEPSMTQGETS